MPAAGLAALDDGDPRAALRQAPADREADRARSGDDDGGLLHLGSLLDHGSELPSPA
jgi:hypothetical protein